MLQHLLAVVPLVLPLPFQESLAQAEERLEALEKEFERASRDVVERMRALPEDEQGAFYSENRVDPEDWVPRFLELARTHPGTETAVNAYAWVLRRASETERDGELLDVLTKECLHLDPLTRVCGALERRYRDGDVYLRRILERSDSEEARAAACYSLGRLHMHLASTANVLKTADEETRVGYANWLGEEVATRLASTEAATLNETAEAYFERLLEEFPGARDRDAERNLFELRNLGYGMVAPEIEGEDIDGVPFKLSDYRGKVVLLDFWGDW